MEGRKGQRRRGLKRLHPAWPWMVLVLVVGAAAAPACPGGPGALGQESPGLSSFGISARFDHIAALDPLVSPRRYGGEGFSQNGFSLTFESRDGLHQLEGWYGTLGVEADDGFAYRGRSGTARTEASSMELGEAAYRHLRRVGESPWWLGLAVVLRVNHTEYEFSAGSAEGFLYFSALALEGRRSLELGEGRRVLFDVSLPLLGWAARPRYSTVDEERLQQDSDFFHRLSTGGFVSPADLQALTGRITYEHPLGSRLGLRSSVRLGYTRHEDVSEYRALQVGIETGVTVGWGGGR